MSQILFINDVIIGILDLHSDIQTYNCLLLWKLDISTHNNIGSWQNIAISAPLQFLFGHSPSTNTTGWDIRNLLCTFLGRAYIILGPFW